MDLKTRYQEGEPTVQQRLDALHRTKNEHTDEKIRRFGFVDTDDHGFIPWSDPIPFEATPNHPDGGCYGMKCIGENFRRWLEVNPVYIHPMSSMAGAWVYKGIPGIGGWTAERGIDDEGRKSEKRTGSPGSPRHWKPEDRPHHLENLHRKYNIYSPGIGNKNHMGPDMRIGLDLGCWTKCAVSAT